MFQAKRNIVKDNSKQVTENKYRDEEDESQAGQSR